MPRKAIQPDQQTRIYRIHRFELPEIIFIKLHRSADLTPSLQNFRASKRKFRTEIGRLEK